MSIKLEPSDVQRCLVAALGELDDFEAGPAPESYSDTTVCASLRQTVVLDETSAGAFAGDVAVVDRVFRRVAAELSCQVQSSVLSGVMEAGSLVYFTWRSVLVRALPSATAAVV